MDLLLLTVSYISINLYRKVIHHAIAEGMREADFKDLATPLEAIDSLQAVPSEHFFALHEMVDQVIGPGFSVRVGQQMVMEDYGVLGLSWRTCAWAGEIYARSERYFKLLSDTYVFKLEKGLDESRVYLQRSAHRRGVELSNEATFSATVVVLRAITESDISPIAVAFQHDPPSQLESYHEAFKCELSFRQSHNFITYHTSDLEMRTAKADTSINQFLVERVEEETDDETKVIMVGPTLKSN